MIQVQPSKKSHPKVTESFYPNMAVDDIPDDTFGQATATPALRKRDSKLSLKQNMLVDQHSSSDIKQFTENIVSKKTRGRKRK